MAAIQIVEDEPVLAHELALALESGGHEVWVDSTAKEGLARARKVRPDLALLDLRLPDRSGLDLIGDLLAVDGSMLVVLMTAYGSTRDAVDAIRRGAVGYLHKPLDLGELGLLIQRLLASQRQQRELEWLRGSGGGTESRPSRAPEFELPFLRRLFDEVSRLVDSSLPAGRRPPILLRGEPGVGAGGVARALHTSLGGGPFLEVSCRMLAGPELEREVFGSEATAPNGGRSIPGLFEAAAGGTLLLDEIADLDDARQARLVDVLEHRQVSRVGSSRSRELDAQVVATTHADLEAEVAAGRFRAELLHRLRVLAYRIPPLRERPEDLIESARHFARTLGVQRDGLPRTFTPSAEQRLVSYPWPGNLRELHNVIERAILVSDDATLAEDHLAAVIEGRPATGKITLPENGLRLEEVERDLIRQALERAGGNRTRASALLGLSRDTFRYRMEKWGLGGSDESP